VASHASWPPHVCIHGGFLRATSTSDAECRARGCLLNHSRTAPCSAYTWTITRDLGHSIIPDHARFSLDCRFFAASSVLLVSAGDAFISRVAASNLRFRRRSPAGRATARQKIRTDDPVRETCASGRGHETTLREIYCIRGSRQPAARREGECGLK